MNYRKTCIDCGSIFTLTPDPECPQVWSDKLQALAVRCQKCAQFGWIKLKTREAIMRVIMAMKLKPAKSDVIMPELTKLLRKYGELLYRHYRMNLGFDESYPTSLVGHPDSVYKSLDAWESGVRAASQERRPVTNDP